MSKEFSTTETKCRFCNGSGKIICSSCHGEGYKTVLNNQFVPILGVPLLQSNFCTTCRGTGKQNCIHCRGTGKA